MAQSRWIPIQDAQRILAERKYYPIAEDWDLAFRFAWQTIIARLASDRLASRTGEPAAFTWTVENEGEPEALPLKDEIGEIDRDFWFHYQAAEESTPRDLITSAHMRWQNQLPHADRAGNDFRFIEARGRDAHWRMKGVVRSVMVDRFSLPIRGKGKPPGGHYKSDPELVGKIVAEHRNTGQDLWPLCRLYAPLAEGSPDPSTVTRRLHDKAKEQIEAEI